MRQILILLALFSIVAAAAALGARLRPAIEFDANTLTATGFILLAAYALGELFRRFRLPALLGYLAAGMLFGPSLASLVVGDASRAPIDALALEQLGLVNMLAVGVIGTMGGGEIRIEDLRSNFRKIASITGLVFISVLPLVGGIVLALSFLAPGLIPFLADVPTGARIAAALLFGALAVGMSPSATLALLLEVRARGPLTSLVLGVVVLADLVLVATFLLALALAKLLVSPEGFSAVRLLEVLPQIGAEFGWAILLGLLVGLVFIVYLRLVGRELLLFSLGIIFITSFVASRLHAETLLAFLVGGFVVQNFSKHGHTLIEAFERIAVPVFVIYFTTQAASLDLVAFTAYLPLTLILVATRCALFYVAVGGAARLARVDDQQRQLLRISFFSQGGVDLVLAAMIAEGIPEWGAEVQTVTIATILIYIVVGPPLLARALDLGGESAAARERGSETLQARRLPTKTPPRTATFASLETGDAALDRRLETLRDIVASSARGMAREADTVHDRRRELIKTLARKITATLDPALARSETANDDALDVERLRGNLQDVETAIASALSTAPPPTATPLHPARLQAVFGRILGAVPFLVAHRVTREAGLFERRGSGWQRLVRLARRVRRALSGPGMRTVPVGRLWRYHVALDVPVALWSGVRAHESDAWARLLVHYRVTARTVEDIAAGRPPVTDEGLLRSLSGGHPSASGSHRARQGEHASASRDADEEIDDAPQAIVSAVELLTQARSAARDREIELCAALDDGDLSVQRCLESAFDLAWSEFIWSIETAGTLEYPAWRYRVSTRYDAAQAATAELRERLGRDLEAAHGIRDALTAMTHARCFEREARRTTPEIGERLAAEVRACQPRIGSALESCSALGLADDDAELDREAAAELSNTLTDLATAVDRVARRLERSEGVGDLASELGDALSQVPEMLEPAPLASGVEDLVARAPQRRTKVGLRAWLEHGITRELTVAALDVRADLVQRLAPVAASLHHAREVLEYHLVTASSVGDDVDRDVGERVSTLLERAGTDLGNALEEAGRVLAARLDIARDLAIPPVLEGRWEDIQRTLRRREEGAVSRAALGQWTRDLFRRAQQRMGRYAQAVRDEVAAVFIERTTPQEARAFRQLLFGPASTMAEAYQRLFTSVPAESVGLVVQRPELRPVLAGIERWLEGGGGPILIRGDRGVGKRTLVRDVTAQVGDRLDTRWLPLSPELEREADVAQALGQMLGWRTCSDFNGLERAVSLRARMDRRPHKPTAVVVANVERLFRRTQTGLDCVRRFFDLVAVSSREVLWIVIFTEPAARLLSPILELEGRFPVTITVPPMTAGQLETVLTTRHRLSGYELRFVHHTPSLHEWLRSPGAAWRARRGLHSATYDRLRLLSGGNVRQAQRLWLAAVRLDADREGGVIVGPIAAMSDTLLEGLPLVSRVLLAALLLHGPLLRQELAEVTLRYGHALDAELTHLVHLGFISISDRSGHIQVGTRLVAPLTEELRACNLL